MSFDDKTNYEKKIQKLNCEHIFSLQSHSDRQMLDFCLFQLVFLYCPIIIVMYYRVRMILWHNLLDINSIAIVCKVHVLAHTAVDRKKGAMESFSRIWQNTLVCISNSCFRPLRNVFDNNDTTFFTISLSSSFILSALVVASHVISLLLFNVNIFRSILWWWSVHNL